MGQDNESFANEFIFLGLSSHQDTQLGLFVLFLGIYVITVVGNTLIITAIHLDPRFNTPMYFFLENLSFLDICYSTTGAPQILAHFLVQHKTISFNRCMAQLFISLTLGGTEFLLLAAMAYDRYVAICNPLQYMVIMRRSICILLAAASWTVGILNALVHTIFTARLRYCGHPLINHVSCELLALIKVACFDTHTNEIAILILNFVVLLVPCFLVLVSYIYIISSILQIHSSQGRHKAFSTCASHLTVVIMAYGTAIFAYSKPKGGKSSHNLNKMIALFYGFITPMLNPIIYSLRNKDVKDFLAKAMRKDHL
ncbi:olfactory receptor-like protein OLF3 [Alligator mississippiensis]|nr:olfactory receptor-like protein OLF3 [Alligator mississippiensis]